MRSITEYACENIDAAVFSGDEFLDKDNRKELRDYMGRWERQLKEYDKNEEEQ